ncbi:hypothetical protein Tco_0885188, partial [Tanacetum coccineum]
MLMNTNKSPVVAAAMEVELVVNKRKGKPKVDDAVAAEVVVAVDNVMVVNVVEYDSNNGDGGERIFLPRLLRTRTDSSGGLENISLCGSSSLGADSVLACDISIRLRLESTFPVQKM